MQISNTTDQSGLVQRVERRRRLPYGSAGNELRTILNDLNSAIDEVTPLLISFNDNIRWDDVNHTLAPKGKINLVANQNEYKILKDGESTPVPILNLTNIRILNNVGDTQYHDLEKLTLDDPRVPEILSPNTAITGSPSAYVEMGNRFYLDVLPSTAITNGIYLFFARQHQLITVTGTSGNDTVEIGIPVIFHELISAIAGHMGNKVDRADDISLLNSEREEIFNMKKELKDFIALRNPTKARMTPKRIKYI